MEWYLNAALGSVTTWEALHKEFLERFIPPNRVVEFRSKITNFRMETGKELHEAWDMFSNRTNRCPQHGFGKAHLLEFLYKGVDNATRQYIKISVKPSSNFIFYPNAGSVQSNNSYLLISMVKNINHL